MNYEEEQILLRAVERMQAALANTLQAVQMQTEAVRIILERTNGLTARVTDLENAAFK